MQATPVETLAWWDTFPTLVREVHALLPVIRQPHWTDWSVTSTVKSLDIGARTYEGDGYLLVANTGAEGVVTQLTLRDYPQPIAEIQDAITHQVIATTTEGRTFELSVPAYDVKLMKIVGTERMSQTDIRKPQ